MSRCPHCGDTHNADNHFCPATGKAIELGPRLIGHTLLDRYRIDTILGEGPTGVVFQVEDISSKKQFAAKLTHPRYVRGSNAGDVLLKEASLAGKLNCPHIARVIEVGRDTGAAPVVVRELMVGRCLAEYIDAAGQMPTAEAVQIARDIVTALEAIHKAGILNLDLSPADVFLDESTGKRVTKLVDFGEGIIKQQMGAGTGDDGDIESHKYYAPEQRRKGHKADARADLFAAGAILYHMLVGMEPARIPTPVNSTRKDADPKLSAVVAKSLAAAPENRYQSARDFINALDDACKVQPEPKPKPKEPAKPAEPPKPAKPAEPPKPERPIPPPVEAPAKVAIPSDPLPEPEPAPKKVEGPVLPTGSDEELAQPSVIVDMPEVAGAGGRKKLFVAIGIVAVLAAAGAIGLYLNGSFSKPAPVLAPPPPPAKVTVTIRVVPDSAVVSVDGQRVMGTPPVVTVEPSATVHTIKAKADGFESLEKDVSFDATKTVELQLIEVVAPDEAAAAIVAPPEPEPEATAAPKKTPPAQTNREPAAQGTAAKPAADKAAEAPRAGAPAVPSGAGAKPGSKAKGSGNGKKKGGFDTSNPYG
jgi:serine/threonine protein kinase